jgi:hypothetical protein
VTAGDVNGDGFSDLLIGAPGYAQSGTDEGRACVFHGSASWPATAPAWVSVGGQVGAGYGSSVGPAGDVNGDGYADVIVGAPEYDETYVDGGRAVVYQGGAAGLATSPTWSLFAAQAAARFGCAVATAGDVNGDGLSDVVVGARGYDHGQADEGWAGAYFGATDLLAVAPDWTAICDQANASFGISVASAGDVNGDGYSDMIVGADMYDAPDLCNGRAYLYLGGPDGLATNPSWVVDGPQYFAFLGVSVASAGDVNGDGYSDVVVGVYRATDTQPEEGLAYLYLGSPQGLSTEPAWIGKSGQAGAWYGYTIAGAGDVNGDGYADVITGAADYDTSAPDGGRVYVYYGSPMGLPAEPSWKIDCSQAYAKLGVWVSGAGDVNGDGYSDVLASAYQYDNGQTDEGRVYLYLGSATGLMATPAWTTEGNQAYCQYGYPANSAGDVNGDGYSDVIVGAPWYDSPGLDGGKVYLYLGGPAGLSTTPDWTATSGQTMARFGITACSAGDVNHDGRSDVLVGAQFYDAGQQDEGRAFLYLGSASGLSPTAAWTTESNQVDGYLGYAGATAGDVNGDGFSDLAVSTYYYDNGSLVDAGRVDLFYGNARTGLRRLPRQMCVNGWEPIVPLGRSDAETGFRLQATGRTPLGRGRVRLQYEVKPAGVPFNGAGLITGPPVWTAEPVEDGSEAQLAEIVGNLSTFSLYHWRLRTLTDSPFFPRSPWFWQPYNSVTEADVRTALIGSAVPDGPLVEATPVLGGFPNPFAAATRLSYSLDGAARVRLEVYDASGRAVACMVDRDEAAGSHSVLWDGRDAQGRAAPNGVYFVRIEAGGHAAVQKVVVRR